MIDAPWEAQSGWGFGGAVSAAIVSGHTYVVLQRQPMYQWIEGDIWRDNVPIAAWLTKPGDSGCNIGGPAVAADATAHVVLLRDAAENQPVVVFGSPETIVAAPSDVERFGPPGGPPFPDGLVVANPSAMVFGENYGHFTARWFSDGTTLRPMPPTAFQALNDMAPLGDQIFFTAWTGALSTAWVVGKDGALHSVLPSTTLSYDGLSFDDAHAAWAQSSGPLGPNQFSHIEIWGGTIASSYPYLTGKYLWTVPNQELPFIALGEGWASVLYGIQDGVVIKFDGSEIHKLPQAGLWWSGQQNDGAAIVGGNLYLRVSKIGSAGNNVQHIVRFNISKLPLQ